MFGLSAKREGSAHSIPSGRIMTVLMLAALITVVCCFVVLNESSPSQADGETSGQCGADLYWTYDTQSGALTITGTGAMTDYSYTDVRWGGNTIRSVSLPGGLTSIGESAFYGCASLSSITIPDSVKTIGSYAFYGCSGLTGPLTIGNGVTAIGDHAFFGCSGFKGSLTIGNSVTDIGDYAFFECSGLTGTLTIPNGVSTIGDYAFYRCSGLTGTLTIPDSATYIGVASFYQCSGLSGSIAIPANVSYIGVAAFDGCTKVTSFDVSSSNLSYSSDGGIIFDKEMTGLIMAPQGKTCSSYSIPASVTWINNYAFIDCTGFTGTLTIHEYVEYIGNSALSGCTGLTSIDVASGNAEYSSDNGILFDKSETTLIAVPAGKTCSSYTIPYNVTAIGTGAFYGCSGFTGTLTITENVTSIGNGAFTGCTGLTAFDVEPSNTSFCSEDGILFDKGKTTLLAVPTGKTCSSYTIPDGVTTIGISAFDGCTGFTGTLTIPNSVTTIENMAFNGCTGFTGTLTIPNSVQYIHSYAFDGCTGFTGTLTIPNSVSNIGDYAFNGCTGIRTIEIGSGVGSMGILAFPSHKFLKGDGVTAVTVGSADFYGYKFIGETADKMIRQDGMVPSHHVTYDVDGGSVAAPVQADVQEGSPFTVADYSGTKSGYTFGGWSYNGNTYQPGANITMGNSDIVLKAVWNSPAPSGDGGLNFSVPIIIIVIIILVIGGIGVYFFFKRKDE